MTKTEIKRDMLPRIVDFYHGKSVLITGAAGFVGMIILEILLRTCPGIESIYILLREKKGFSVEARRKRLFEKRLFQKIKEEQPEVFNKVHVVKGDVVLPDLGLDEESLQEIIPNVTIVFHCAADISFLKPVRVLLESNALGTQNVVDLCKKLNKIEVLLYTSTICSNCNRNTEIQEEIYRLPFPSKKFLDELKNGTDESLDALISECMPAWPNAYSFSKSLAENILLENAKHVPFSVIRPSLVSSIWKEPLKGFAEKNSALVLLSVGAAKGFIKVMLVDPNNLMDFVPADVTGNAHIIAAWKVATERSRTPLVVNCTSYGTLDYTWDTVQENLSKMAKANPLPNTFRAGCDVQMVKTVAEYRALAFYEHYVPAYVIDFLLKMSGKKEKLVPLYRLFDKAMLVGKFFVTGSWKFAVQNFKSLEDGLDEEEKTMFVTNYTDLNLEEYVSYLPSGNEIFDWKKDKRTMQQRMKIAQQRYYLTCFIKYAFIVIVFTLLYLVISKGGQLIGVF